MLSGLYVAGTGVCIPEVVPMEDAIRAGLYRQEYADHAKQLGAAVAPPDVAPVDLAVAAGRDALNASGLDPNAIGYLAYAVVFDAGLDLWCSASYVQEQLGMRAGWRTAYEIRGTCDRSFLALGEASAHMSANPDCEAALIVAADCWREPAFKRWTEDDWTIYGDAGGGIVLSRQPSPLRLLSICSYCDPMERFLRGDEPLRMSIGEGRNPISLAGRTDQFLARQDRDEIKQRLREGAQIVARRALAEAGASADDVDHVVLPGLGLHVLWPYFAEPLGVELDRTSWQYTRKIGHTGAADPLIALDALARDGAFQAGTTVLVVVPGGPGSWVGAVLRAE
jgi:3-oxoacyl-[acyl-carrier-protein] synthase-3